MLTAAPSCSKEKTPTPPENKTTPAADTAEPAISDTAKKEKRKTAFPTLDILPEGSILRRVKLPRYDKDFNPLSLLKADKLTVIDQNQIAAEGISVILFDDSGAIRGQSQMHRATYSQLTSVIEAKEAITMKGESYSATGTGLILNFNDGRGFLLGPATTTFQTTQSEPQE